MEVGGWYLLGQKEVRGSKGVLSQARLEFEEGMMRWLAIRIAS